MKSKEDGNYRLNGGRQNLPACISRQNLNTCVSSRYKHSLAGMSKSTVLSTKEK